MSKRIWLILMAMAICLSLPPAPAGAADQEDAVYADGTVLVTADGLGGLTAYLIRVVDTASNGIVAMKQANADGDGLLSVSITTGFLEQPGNYKVYINDLDGEILHVMTIRSEDEAEETDSPPAEETDSPPAEETDSPPAGQAAPPPSATQDPPQVTVQEEAGFANVSYTVQPATDQDGDNVLFEVERDVISQMADLAKEAAGDDKQSTIEFQLKLDEEASFEMLIPRDGWQEIAAETNTSVKVNAGYIDITFDQKTVETINKRKLDDVSIRVSPGDKSALDDSALEKIGDRPLYDISVRSGDAVISDFEGGKVSVSFQYTAKPHENANAIVVYYINEDGKLQSVRGKYNPQTGRVAFVIHHFSLFAVGYNPVDFKDVPPHAWYSDAVEFLAARGIVQGTGNGMFNPDLEVTRADFLIMVMHAYGIALDEEITDNFLDAGDRYYARYLATAKRLGLVSGVGGGNYAPDEVIARQDMFVILHRILAQLNELPDEQSGGKQTDDFADAAHISDYALETIERFVEAGIVQGDGTRLNPKDTSTRAQAVRTLYSLLTR